MYHPGLGLGFSIDAAARRAGISLNISGHSTSELKPELLLLATALAVILFTVETPTPMLTENC